MARCALVLTVALVFMGAHAHAAYHNVRTHGFLRNGLQPEAVARTLVSVEEEWKAQAALSVECNSSGTFEDCAKTPDAFAKSCSTVVGAVVQGSGGDHDNAKEYMSDICAQASLKGWHKEGCMNLAVALDKSMSADSYENRMNFDSSSICTRFWSSFLETEKKRAAEEKAAREEEERKAAEEAAAAEKKRQEEAAAAAKKAAEEAAAEAERKKKEAAKKKEEEMKKAAEEAKAKAAEAAKRLAQKKAEAEAVAEAAKKKMEEAEAAEKEHQELQAKLKTVTAAKPPAVQNENSTAVTQQTTPAASVDSTASTPAPKANKVDKVPEATTVAAVATVPAEKQSKTTK